MSKEGVAATHPHLDRLAAAEKALAASEESYRFLADMAPQIVWTADADGRLLHVNRRWIEYFGVTLEQARASEFEGLQLPEDRSKNIHQYHAAIALGQDFRLELAIRRHDGQYRWHYLQASALRDSEGNIVRWFGAFVDIHERKVAEQSVRRANEALEAAVRQRTDELVAANRELEGFTYSVSHDLRSPIRAIASTCHILREDYGELLPDTAHELLDRQAAAAAKLGRLIDELLQLSRIARTELAIAPFDISAMASELANDVIGRSGNPRLKADIEPGLVCMGDPRLVRYVLLNLFENAAKFSPEGGTICFGQRNGAFFVEDQGIGFDMKYGEKIWRPFERLVRDSEYPGSGIGLANVQRIAMRHRGRAWAESTVGEGSTFYFAW